MSDLHNVLKSRCCTCGFEWNKGADGSHSCAMVMTSKINNLEDELHHARVLLSAESNISLPVKLRDWFAGMALQGLAHAFENYGTSCEVATSAYELADAMIKARESAN